MPPAEELRWLIKYEDPDHPDELFPDEAVAKAVMASRLLSWNCHLFVLHSHAEEAVKAATEELREAIAIASSESVRQDHARAKAVEAWHEERQAREKAEEERDEVLADAEEARDIVKILFPNESGEGLRSLVLDVINERDALRKRVEELETILRNTSPRVIEASNAMEQTLAEHVEQARREGAEEMRERVAVWHEQSANDAARSHSNGEEWERVQWLRSAAAWIRTFTLPIDPPKAPEPVELERCPIVAGAAQCGNPMPCPAHPDISKPTRQNPPKSQEIHHSQCPRTLGTSPMYICGCPEGWPKTQPVHRMDRTMDIAIGPECEECGKPWPCPDTKLRRGDQ